MPTTVTDIEPAADIVEAELLDDDWELLDSAELTVLERQVEDQRQQVIENERSTGAFLAHLAEINPELFHQAKATEEDAYRTNTQRSYKYWMSRFRRWCEDPSTRFRGADAPAQRFDELFPTSFNSELVFRVWLEDVVTGPADEDEWEEWNEKFGKFSPNTLSIIQAAFKWEISKHQTGPWEPTTSFKKWWKGFRNQCRLGYKERQATPVCGDELYKIGRHLFLNRTPLVASDRLVLEATVAGLSPADIGRLTLGSVLTDATGTVTRKATTDDGDIVEWEEPALFDGKRLVVPGRRRPRGVEEDARVIDLGDWPKLAAAIDEWLAVRNVDGDKLLFGDVGNPPDRARKSLLRTAELAGIEGWKPVAGKKIPKAKIAMMRAALDGGEAWGGELARRRSHVMLLVGFTVALRRSELCALTIGDVTFHDAQTAEIWISIQKSSDKGSGLVLANPQNNDPAIQRTIDTVPLLRAWVDTLLELGATPDTPLFPALDRHGNFYAGSPAVTGQAWSGRLNQLAKAAKAFGDDLDDPRYKNVTGHSLRRGFITDAVDQGIDPIKIARITRHKNVNMIARYADERRAFKDRVVSKLFLGIAA